MQPDLFKDRYRAPSIRLPHRDYGASGGYFVTICTKNWGHFLGDVVDEQSSLGAIIRCYKSAVTRWCRNNGYNDFGWRSRFYEPSSSSTSPPPSSSTSPPPTV